MVCEVRELRDYGGLEVRWSFKEGMINLDVVWIFNKMNILLNMWFSERAIIGDFD